MKRFLFYLLTILSALWIQLCIFHFLGGTGAVFDMALIVVLYFGLSRGPFTAQLLGFALGMLIGAATMGALGLHALLYAITGYAAGLVSRQLDESKIWGQSLFTFILSICFFILYSGVDHFTAGGSRPFQWSLLAQPVVNALLAPLIFWLLELWSSLWNIPVEAR